MKTLESYFQYLTSDVKDLHKKLWLATALKANAQREFPNVTLEQCKEFIQSINKPGNTRL